MIRKIALCLPVLLLICMMSPMSVHASQIYDDTYEGMVAEIMKSYEESPGAAISALEAIDTELLGVPEKVEHCSNTMARGTAPSDYTLYVYSFKRGNSGVYYLQWVLKVHAKEWSPGPLDYVSLEWDTNYASYYLSNGNGDTSTVQGRSTGIVLFNLEDDRLSSGDTVYGTVQVSPKAAGVMEYGSKFVHTYTLFTLAGSASVSFAPSSSLSSNGDFSLGLTHTMGYSVSVGVITSQWQLWADNAVTLPDQNYY